ncbi:squalene/phytoene synthase family protein [Arsenicitalea aurantiaca]|uniref:Squalene/phytoene synthase family protein n=1 Tax=Arsenicitalea aurantiaca TaxID=1783274 RepID=A0A433XFN7_9HYPH|nr:phytoene/squalene synthase family protein [Arsenicitalea aurantiaca]RUT32758.1 squalene/phytoene synthase family protein [Arsenicitalea aurantiaca]
MTAPAERDGIVADFLREHDRDRYLASLVLPQARRAPIQALYAFAAEIAAVRERVSEPAPGEIRLQWWTDALSGEGHGSVRANPVADALLSAIGEYGLPTVPLLRLIAARRFDLYDDPMPDLPTFEGYAGETVSVLFQYAAMILNDGQPVEPGDAAGHLGVANALVGHLRAFGHMSSRGRIMLPLAMLTANGVSEHEIFSGTPSEGLAEAHGQFVGLARLHLDKAETAIRALPTPLRPAFAQIAVLRRQLALVERQAGSPFAAPADLADWRKIAVLAGWRLRRG